MPHSLRLRLTKQPVGNLQPGVANGPTSPSLLALAVERGVWRIIKVVAADRGLALRVFSHFRLGGGPIASRDSLAGGRWKLNVQACPNRWRHTGYASVAFSRFISTGFPLPSSFLDRGVTARFVYPDPRSAVVPRLRSLAASSHLKCSGTPSPLFSAFLPVAYTVFTHRAS